jgi:hypothetical protein
MRVLRVHFRAGMAGQFLPEYYSQDQWSDDFLKSIGINQIDKTPPNGQAAERRAHTRNGMHDDIYYEAQVAVQDPTLIRAQQRQKAGLLSLHGVDESPISKTADIGKKLAEYRADFTAEAFKKSLQKLRGSKQ